MDGTEPMAADRTPQSQDKRARAGVQSLDRAFSILEVVASHPAGISLGQLSSKVALHNSTAHHLARTMVGLGYLRQRADNKRYQIGRKIFALAAGLRNDIDFVEIAEPILADLSAKTGESSHLAIYAGNEVVVVARSAGTGAFQLREAPGGIRPGHATALGKVLLAGVDEETRSTYLDSHGLPSLTDRTIVDRDRLLAEIDEIQRTRIAYDDGEFNAEVRCVAVPVLDFTGRTVAALGLSGPAWRLTLQALHRITETVQAAATDLSNELGGTLSD